MFRSARHLIFVILFSALSANADVTETFETVQARASSNAVWNLHEGRLHPPLQIWQWSGDFATFYDTPIDVGDGRHGVFNSSSYARFSEGGDVTGQVIRLNTDQYPELNLISFTLDAGWTIRPTGSNPLVIRSQGPVVIHGLIDCRGEDGEAQSADNTVVSRGGRGACGGASGGDGASTVLAATAGNGNGTATVTSGGAAGANSTNINGGGGGGGGGSFSQLAYAPSAGGSAGGGASGGAAGPHDVNDPEFQSRGGGAGGGGGGLHSDSSGGGGGGGGGIIEIIAVGTIDIQASGLVTADGGRGGGGTGKGGGGGGGGGGTILLWSAGQVNIDGAVSAERGIGGISSGPDGGQGAVGRVWATCGDAGGLYYGNAPTPDVLLLPGEIRYQTGSFASESIEFDMVSTQTVFHSATMTTSGTGSETVEVLTSDAPFTGSETDWLAQADWPQAAGRRYVRYRLTLVNTSDTDPRSVDSLLIRIERKDKTDFRFESGCGAVEGTPWDTGLWLILLILAAQIGRRLPLHSKHKARLPLTVRLFSARQ